MVVSSTLNRTTMHGNVHVYLCLLFGVRGVDVCGISTEFNELLLLRLITLGGSTVSSLAGIYNAERISQ